MSIEQMPLIVKETSRGLDRITLFDDCLQKRIIPCVTEINEDSVNSMVMQLLYLEKEDADAEVTFYINSPGGSVQDGLVLYDVMQAVSCPIRTVCMGMAASMGSIIFVAGDKRQMLKHSKVMIHDPLITGDCGGPALSVDAISKRLMRTRRKVGEILSQCTGRPLDAVLSATARDTFFDAQQAKAFRLVDEIIADWGELRHVG